MTEGQAIVLFGNVSDGFRAVGPFPTRDDACTYAERKEMTEEFFGSWIMTLEEPKP